MQYCDGQKVQRVQIICLTLIWCKIFNLNAQLSALNGEQITSKWIMLGHVLETTKIDALFQFKPSEDTFSTEKCKITFGVKYIVHCVAVFCLNTINVICSMTNLI